MCSLVRPISPSPTHHLGQRPLFDTPYSSPSPPSLVVPQPTTSVQVSSEPGLMVRNTTQARHHTHLPFLPPSPQGNVVVSNQPKITAVTQDPDFINKLNAMRRIEVKQAGALLEGMFKRPWINHRFSTHPLVRGRPHFQATNATEALRGVSVRIPGRA